MSTNPNPILTADEYLAIERKADFRSEYVDGEVYAMAGGSTNHALLSAALIARLDDQLRDRPCSVAGSDLRLYCEPARTLTYADAVVFCEPARYREGQKDTLVDAVFIAEVLSPSTQNYDRGEKFRCYRSLPSFSEYLLIAQTEIAAEHHVKQADRSWLFREWSGAEAEIELPSIGCRLRLGDLYRKVRFER
jgi:Uma2 family endonuclease